MIRRSGVRPALEAALQRLWFSPSPGFLPALLRALLAPASLLTRRIASARRARINAARREHPRPAPDSPIVIIVGNVIAGGAGKTPLTLALAAFLVEHGWSTGLICRGGSAAARAASIVQPANAREANQAPVDSTLEIGDEARLLADASGLPVAIGHQRAQALALLTRTHPGLQVVLSDDGLQHEALHRHVELIVMDRRGLGNGRLLPAGPLREPANVLQTVDAIIVNRGLTDAPPSALATDVPVFESGLVLRDIVTLSDYHDSVDRARQDAPAQAAGPAGSAAATAGAIRNLSGKRLAAVAGIANPESFFGLLESLGLEINRHAPGDHAPIDAKWVDSLPEAAVIMTEKDAVKCSGSRRKSVYVLRIEARPEPALFAWLSDRIQSLRRNHHGPSHT